MRVALACNMIRPSMIGSGPLDAIAELDSEETLNAVETALRDGGHVVVRIDVDAHFAERLRAEGADIVFNIAEGISTTAGVRGGASRESIVPAVCELLGVPCTGSSVLATALCLDKPRTKQVLAAHDIATPRFQLFDTGAEPLDGRLRFPLIAKLAREGSSMGLRTGSVVDDEAGMRREVSRLVATYRTSVIVEEFIEGREFTVGLIGNEPQLVVLPIVEVVFNQPRGINLFDPDGPVRAMAGLPASEQTQAEGHSAVCPAELQAGDISHIGETARRAFRALGCADWCRIDFRMSIMGEFHVLELNPIAGIDPSYLLPRAAAAARGSR